VSTERADHAPPCPSLTLSVDVSHDLDANEAALVALPAKPGVLIIEDEAGGTLSLLQTADLRRAARVRLGPVDPEQVRSKRVDLRPLARKALACAVGSSFEADWATLQLARNRLPHSYKSMLDRWQVWFVHCDEAEEFPQWVKTAHPSETRGVHIGPFADKHAAARFREMLEDAFDLCRYHHILVQAPHAGACAYKEMGRCPAPCDGTVSMQRYHQQIRDSIEFAKNPLIARQSIDARMRERAAALDFESAGRDRTLLDRTAACDRSEFAHVRDLDSFRFLAVLPSEREGFVRMFAIIGGLVCPLDGVQQNPSDDVIAALISQAADLATDLAPSQVARDAIAIENIGLVCRHLLWPKAQAKRRRAEFLRWEGRKPDIATLKKAIARVLKPDAPMPSEDKPAAPELELEIGL
jgi:excinuclease UvrABC nuclease subunit